MLSSNLKCTQCGGSISSNKDIKRHPTLGVLQCSACHAYYNQVGDLSQYRGGEDINGQDNYCRWCLNGGDLIMCGDEYCRNAFCRNCISRNLGENVCQRIEKSDDWFCFLCEYTQLDELRAMVPIRDKPKIPSNAASTGSTPISTPTSAPPSTPTSLSQTSPGSETPPTSAISEFLSLPPATVSPTKPVSVPVPTNSVQESTTTDLSRVPTPPVSPLAPSMSFPAPSPSPSPPVLDTRASPPDGSPPASLSNLSLEPAPSTNLSESIPERVLGREQAPSEPQAQQTLSKSISVSSLTVPAPNTTDSHTTSPPQNLPPQPSPLTKASEPLPPDEPTQSISQSLSTSSTPSSLPTPSAPVPTSAPAKQPGSASKPDNVRPKRQATFNLFSSSKFCARPSKKLAPVIQPEEETSPEKEVIKEQELSVGATDVEMVPVQSAPTVSKLPSPQLPAQQTIPMDTLDQELAVSDSDEEIVEALIVPAVDVEKKKDPHVEWVIRDVKSLKERLQTYVNSLQSTLDTYDEKRFRDSQENLFSWASNLETYLNHTKTIQDRCTHLFHYEPILRKQ